MCLSLLRLHLTSAYYQASGMDGIIQLGEEDRLSDDTLRGEIFYFLGVNLYTVFVNREKYESRG